MNAPNFASPLFARRGAQILFEEDFDLPSELTARVAPPEPEVIEPTFTADEMKVAREEAWREADELARAELTGAREQAVLSALSAITEQLREARLEAQVIAEASAEAIAQLLVGSFAAAFPALCREHGNGEVKAVLQKILPALDSEPKVTIRVAPDAVPDVRRELDRLDNDLAEIVKVVAVETMTAGDVRIQWRAGQAIRDTTRIWQDIEAALAPAGLLPPLLDILQQKMKETVDVE